MYSYLYFKYFFGWVFVLKILLKSILPITAHIHISAIFAHLLNVLYMSMLIVYLRVAQNHEASLLR